MLDLTDRLVSFIQARYESLCNSPDTPSTLLGLLCLVSIVNFLLTISVVLTVSIGYSRMQSIESTLKHYEDRYYVHRR